MNFDNDEIKDFKNALDNVFSTQLKNVGIARYVSAIVAEINSDGTYNLYIPPDVTKLVKKICNKSGESLSVGDSVELCTKNGSINNAWIAIKHGISSGGGSGTFDNLTVTNNATVGGNITANGSITSSNGILIGANNFPINSVVITATNSAPSLPGTWTLIDKEFSSLTGNTGVTLNDTNCTAVGVFKWIRAGHSITVTINFTNKVQIADSTLEMFVIDYSVWGITQLYENWYGQTYTDAGQCSAFCLLDASTGAFSTVDLIPDNYISAGRSDNRTTLSLTIPKEYMLDSACDKFYWKRTA